MAATKINRQLHDHTASGVKAPASIGRGFCFDAAAVVGDQRQQFRWHLLACRAWGGRERQGVADLLQARVLLRAAGDLAAPLRLLAWVSGGHGGPSLSAGPTIRRLLGGVATRGAL
ncbi:hypothetical protein [Streptomyces sp. NPDC048192]|uniref:hypothetical protein n=1 Tax=Streptomyces sp. NPDC048192 TaxID=3365510 RepID=UPI00371B1980